MELQNLSLHLLECFRVLVEEKSVSRAAERMDMSQPGMSNVLARLREALGDPILIRSGNGMLPTPYAMEAANCVQNALDEIYRIIEQKMEFSPGNARTKFRIACLDGISILAFIPIVKEIRRLAPNIEIFMNSLSNLSVKKPLEEGEIDLAIGYFMNLPPGLYTSKLIDDNIACMVSRNNKKLIKNLDIHNYIHAHHCFSTLNHGALTTVELMVNRALHNLGVQRKSWMKVPYLNLIAEVVANTDLVSALPSKLIYMYSKRIEVELLDIPLDIPSYALSMVWHERTHKSKAHVWLRDQIRTACR